MRPLALLCASSLLLHVTAGCMPVIALRNAKHMSVDRAFAKTEEKRFRVVDIETNQPVPNAKVHAVYNFDWLDDWGTEVTADDHGIATINLALEYAGHLNISASAPGYMGRGGSFRGQPQRGIGQLSDDPVEIGLYSGSGPQAGLRIPASFRGTLHYTVGPPKHEPYDIAAPSEIKPGQRVWWTDLAPDGAVTVLEPPPHLGSPIGNSESLVVATNAGQSLPVAEPGAQAEGVAAWPIGVDPAGGIGRSNTSVLVIGTRADALAEASRLWLRHRNGETVFIFNGWLALVAPDAPRTTTPGYGVTRSWMNLR